MNNSLSLEEPKDGDTADNKLQRMHEREGVLVKIVEAIGSLSNTNEWSTLKTYVFDGVVENLEKRLVAEAKKRPLVPEELYQLQGQITWAKRYSNLEELREMYRLELTNVRALLK